jgi:hypothetical protein
MTTSPLFTQEVCGFGTGRWDFSTLLTKLDGRGYAFGRANFSQDGHFSTGDFQFSELDTGILSRGADGGRSSLLSSATAADLDGDGRVEVLLSYVTEPGRLVSSFNVQENALPPGSLSGCGIVVAGDFNADGRTDVAAFCAGGVQNTAERRALGGRCSRWEPLEVPHHSGPILSSRPKRGGRRL